MAGKNHKIYYIKYLQTVLLRTILHLNQKINAELTEEPTAEPTKEIITDNEIILSIPAGKDTDDIITYVYSAAMNEGPEDLIVTNEGGIYILNACGHNILYYESGELKETTSTENCGRPTRILYKNNTLYVFDVNRVCSYSIVTKKWTEYKRIGTAFPNHMCI